MPGLDINRFVGEIDSELVCEICNKVYVDPVANSCPHIFCYTCIKKRLASDGSRFCPVCNEDLKQKPTSPPETLKLKLSSLQVKCTKDCDTVVLLKDLKSHMEKDCSNASVSCPNKSLGCKQMPKRKSLDRHTEECDYRYVNCEACGYKTLYYDLFVHQKRKKCLDRILRREIVSNVRKLNESLEKHRHELLSQNVKLQQREREQIKTHILNKSKKHNQNSEDDVSTEGSDVGSSTESSPSHGQFCNSPRDDPSYQWCRRCQKYFHPDKNHDRACRWHQGPIINLFGGSCQSCGRLDTQKGCQTGNHLDPSAIEPYSSREIVKNELDSEGQSVKS